MRQSFLECSVGIVIEKMLFKLKDWLKKEFLFPPIDEQKKIAGYISSINELIAIHTNKYEALKAKKIGLIQQLFPIKCEVTPKLRFPEFIGSTSWVISPLGEVAQNLDSKRIPITGKDRVNGSIPYYGASGVIDHVNDYIFDEELLCISEDGANLLARTYPIAFSISGKTWVNNHAHILKFKSFFTQKLVENYLNSIDLEHFLTGVAQPKLNRAKLDIIPIPLPGEKEQRKISTFLCSLDELILEQGNKVKCLKSHKKGMMQQLFPAYDGNPSRGCI